MCARCGNPYLTEAQVRILKEIGKEDAPKSLTQILVNTDISPRTVTRSMKAMPQYLKRELRMIDSRRVALYTLTPKGILAANRLLAVET